MTHISSKRGRDANLLGALALAVVDRLGDRSRSPSDAAGLVHLRLRPGESVDFLARVLGLTHSGAVRLVDRLVIEGVVERRPGRDGRSVALFLTNAGEGAAELQLQKREQALDEILGALTAQERAQFVPLLERILATLPEDRWSARHICRLCDYPTCATPSCPVDRAVGVDVNEGTRR